jgi:hypothetical protein
MKNIKYLISFSLLFSLGLLVSAQEKEASMSISFDKVDGKNVCNVMVSSEDKPVAEVSVSLYVERLFGLLPIKTEVATEENGVATFEFPDNLPLNDNGKLVVLAKVEDDDNYGSFEAKTETQIGVPKDLAKLDNSGRSLSGGRDKAPIYFIIASISIIAGIWGTLAYVLLQVFKLKKLKTV